MKKFVKLALVALTLLPLGAWAEKGSGGTTGGVDHLIALYPLLPATLRLEADYPYPKGWNEMTPNGKHRYFGVFPGTSHPEELRIVFNFDRDFFIQKQEIPIFGQGIQGNLESDPVAGEYEPRNPYSKKGMLVIGSKRGTLVGEDQVDNLTMYQGERRIYPKKLRITYEGEEISQEEFLTHLQEIEEVLYNQLDFNDSETVDCILAFDQLRTKLTLRSHQSRLEKAYLEFLKESVAEIDSAYQRTIDSRGNCARQGYEQFVAKFRSFIASLSDPRDFCSKYPNSCSIETAREASSLIENRNREVSIVLLLCQSTLSGGDNGSIPLILKAEKQGQ